MRKNILINSITYILTGISCVLINSCQDFTDDSGMIMEDPKLSFAEDVFEASFSEKEYEVSINANHPWRVKTDADWIEIIDANGDGNDTYKIKVNENTEVLPREAEITAWIIEGTEYKQKIKQDGAGISWERQSISVFSEAQFIEAKFSTTVDYTMTISEGCDWLTVDKIPSATPGELKTFTIKIQVKEFTGDDKREASIFLNGENGKTSELVISQVKSMGDKEYLRMFFDKANGINWAKKWNFDAEFKTDDVNWPGLKITNGYVTEINFTENGIKGDISILCNLRELRTIKLKHEEITCIPAEIGNLKNLETLWLIESKLTGSIPTSITNCTKLSSFNISNHPTNTPAGFENKVEGTLDILKDINSIVTIKVYCNNFSGGLPNLTLNNDGVPEEWPNLKEFLIYSNPLGGSIPEGYGKLFDKNDVTSVVMKDCELTGTIPQDLKECSYYKKYPNNFKTDNNLTE